MMATEKKDKIDVLLDMVEHPERYSEEEASELMADRECREIYDIMVKARQGYALDAEREGEADGGWPSQKTVDEEWRKFAGRNYPRRGAWHWRKAAAVFAGVVMLSGIALAAVHISGAGSGGQKAVTETVEQQAEAVQGQRMATVADTVAVRPRQFENVTLDRILAEMAAHYNIKVDYRSSNAKAMRLYFKWNPQDDVAKVIEALNVFDKVNIEMKGDTVVVE